MVIADREFSASQRRKSGGDTSRAVRQLDLIVVLGMLFWRWPPRLQLQRRQNIMPAKAGMMS
jgi:hypothetical protein